MENGMLKRKFVIDTDAGLDDAHAILMALSTSDVDVVAITTVTGNAKTREVANNVLRLLKVADRLDIPVYEGCEDMLLGWEKPEDYNYHGKDGFGDVPEIEPISNDLLQKQHGVQTLLDLTKKYPGEITLVAIGPLTNVAMALRMDRDFGARLKACYIMGGNYRAEGNIGCHSEFNFHMDPEAAFIVLNHLRCPITIACWELCLKTALSWEQHQQLRTKDTPLARFLSKIEHFTVTQSKENQTKMYELADEAAMACALCNDAITESYDVYASVELHGHVTRGQMCVDWRKLMKKDANVKLVTGLNKDVVFQMLLNSV